MFLIWVSSPKTDEDSQVDVGVEVDEADEGHDEGDDEARQVHVVEYVVRVHSQVRRLDRRWSRGRDSHFATKYFTESYTNAHA